MKTLVRILGIIALLGAAIVLLASVTALGSPDTFGAFLVAAIGLGLAGGLSLLAAQAVELLQQIAGGIAGLQAQAARAAAGPDPTSGRSLGSRDQGRFSPDQCA